MALAPGDRFGPYVIVAPLGAGGMGEVYKARDTRLNRTVALKILSMRAPDCGPGRERLRREGVVISRLSHPHICNLFDVGSESGADYLVMECVEGDTLQHRLSAGPLVHEEFWLYAIQIAGALDHAHRAGVVHRDLKPANIMITRESGIKLLDFGIALLVAAPTSDGAGATTQTQLTESGMIVGTPQYMSPEQVLGKNADARSDIFAFGAVLFEMAAGRKAFSAGSNAALMAAIVSGERPCLGPAASPALERVISKCLARDPDQRWQSARDLKSELEWIQHGAIASPVAPWRRYAMWAALILALGGLGFGGWRWYRAVPGSAPLARLTIPLPDEGSNVDPGRLLGPPVISPDGNMVVTALASGTGTHLLLRRLDADRFETLRGTESATFPFWSPDSRQIGFFTDAKLKKVAVSGGEPQTLCPVQGSRGGTWNHNGTILYGVNYKGLFRVPDTGGEPVVVSGLDDRIGENSKRYPVFLPDGQRFVYFSRTTDEENRGVYLDSLDTPRKSRKRLLVCDGAVSIGRDPRSGGNYLIFSRAAKLWAQRFDTAAGELTGDAVSIADMAGNASVSETGTLVFRGIDQDAALTWFDRNGKSLGTVGPKADYYQLELSPDGRSAAVNLHRVLSGYFAIWLHDITRNVSSPISLENEHSFDPQWAPESDRLYFRQGAHLWSRAVDDARPGQSVAPWPADYHLRDLSADGKYLVAEMWQGRRKLLMYSTFGESRWRQLAGGGELEEFGQFSPDGHWLAYDSNASGSQEIYLTDFPASSRRKRISTAGGKQPRWRRDGKELFYHGKDDSIVAVDLRTGAESSLFKVTFPYFGDGPHYSVSADGQRILVVVAKADTRSRDLNVIVNWPQLLGSRNR